MFAFEIIVETKTTIFSTLTYYLVNNTSKYQILKALQQEIQNIEIILIISLIFLEYLPQLATCWF